MPYRRGDGNLHITFSDMGHGDFVLIALPNGKLVVIDCGSRGFDGNYWNPKQESDVLLKLALESAFRDQRLLANSKVIDLLILTHPDKDHCFYLNYLFKVSYEGHAPAVSISQAFYSNDLATYDKHGAPSVLLTYATEIYSITVNQTKSECAKVDKAKAKDRKSAYLTAQSIPMSNAGKAELLKKSNIDATKGFVKVLDGKGTDGIECGVYILASNVESYPNLSDGSDPKNRGSIVTMIIYGDKKLLFMGDGTFNTEYFLTQTYGDRIKNVELLHVPHHASLTSSSTALIPKTYAIDFVGSVNPCYAVICAAWDVGPQLGLPRYEVIDRYHGGSRLKTKDADIDAKFKTISCYREESRDVVTKKDKEGNPLKTKEALVNAQAVYAATKHVWCTGSAGAIVFDYGLKAGSVQILPMEAFDA